MEKTRGPGPRGHSLSGPGGRPENAPKYPLGDGAGPFWRISDLTVSYGEAIALSSVSLDIRKGSITTVIGPSGCGKSSFLCCLNRLTELIPGCCVSGRILLGSTDILGGDIDDTELRRKVGLVFQNPNPFPLSIGRNIELPLREHGMRDRDEIDARIEESLEATGLWREVKDRLKKPALELSGGQQQRLCIARALALKPDALLMDEPCSALDPISAGAVEELVTSLREHYTIVIVTHNLRQARRLGTDAAFFWMHEGSGALIEAGPVDQIFEAPRRELTRMYVGGGLA
ncbi:MAG: phosphate ABC transporter ATP-binding protein [Alphaproteobacteria bacterium]